ncbi:DUF6264 family protein [Agromyces italicus]|uniref:DUF6264 family protein n=1 Tax=Agromyces italicus TaxID=279572 RepID=UPI0003B60042|nr:DUF6264 family protein [Agromyces italicus]
MTRDEAARPYDGGRADETATGAAAPQAPATPTVPPADERPRPRYGEYAPEGWTWQPPADPNSSTPPAQTPDAAAPAFGAAPTLGGTPVPASQHPGAAAARPTDRAWTIALLVFGAMGAVYNILSIIAMPASVLESMKLSASMIGTTPPTEFTPGPAVPVAVAVGVIAQLALWVGALLWSRARMRAGGSSWWIPLVAGIVAFIVVMIVGAVVLTSDPALVEFLQTPPAV